MILTNLVEVDSSISQEYLGISESTLELYAFSYKVANILLILISYIYIVLKFYKTICYSKITMDWLPIINPYVWPFTIFHDLSRPYFNWWSSILPGIKFGKNSLDISIFIGLEALNAIIYFLVRLANILVIVLEKTEMFFTR